MNLSLRFHNLRETAQFLRRCFVHVSQEQGVQYYPPATSANMQIIVKNINNLRGLTKLSHAWQDPFALKYRKGTDRLAGAFAILRVAG